MSESEKGSDQQGDFKVLAKKAIQEQVDTFGVDKRMLEQKIADELISLAAKEIAEKLTRRSRTKRLYDTKKREPDDI